MTTNILKVRDDHQPIKFEPADDGKFKLCEGIEAQWISSSEFGLRELRSRIEPWLTSLFQSEHLTLLAGSGLTHAVHTVATGSPATGMSGTVTEGEFKAKIESAAELSAKAAGRERHNIEDRIRASNELLRGLEILGASEKFKALQNDLSAAFLEFSQSILKSESGISTANGPERERAFNNLVTFLMSFASRTGTRDRLNIFTTNYDRLIEAGAEIAGIHLLDRFIGNLTPIFRSSRLDLDMHYNPPGIRGEPRYLEGVARYTKLHGSVDWVQAGKDIRRIGLPFGASDIKPYLKVPGIEETTPNQLMIYPNSAKDSETSVYPYVELFRDLAAVICRPNGTLVTYGYSFGDEHINRVIRDMLTIPSTHLVVISRDDNLGRIMPIAEERKSQVSLLVGPHLAELSNLTEYFLPKAAIDRATSRMSELLKQRHGTEGSPRRDENSQGEAEAN
jgi:hypothetical protein